jgi:hypothetical protein
MRFRTVVEPGGKNPTGLPVPEDVVTALGTGKRPAVLSPSEATPFAAP